MPRHSPRTGLLLWGALIFLWAGLIFFGSHQPGYGGNWEPTLWYVIERKSAHVFEYAVLAFLLFRFFRLVYPGESLLRLLALSFIFALCYGVTDELHQFFISGRGAKLSDVAVDGLGALVGCLLVVGWQMRIGKRMNKIIT